MTTSDQTPAGVAEETQPAHETRGSIDLAIDAMRGDPESANYARLYRIERYIDALQSRLTAALKERDEARSKVGQLEIMQDMIADAVDSNREVTAVAVCAALAKALGIQLPKKLTAIFEEGMQRITTVVGEFDKRSNELLDTQFRLTAAEERERKLVEALRKLEEELREFARCEEDTRDCVEVDLHCTFARIADIATNALLAGSKG